MSLYIGKNSASKSPLIITQNAHTLEEMKSTTLPADTIFSTSFSFLECKVFALTNILNINNSYFNTTITGMLDSIAIDYIYSRLSSTTVIPLIMYAIDGKIVTNCTRMYNSDTFMWDFLDTGTLPDSAYSNHARPFPTSVYKYKAFQIGSTGSSINTIVLSLNVSKNGSTISNSSNTVFDTSNTVHITKNSIVVNGVDLTTLRYLTLKDIPLSAKFIGNATGSTISIPNLNLSSSSCYLKATHTNISIINYNNEHIFDTDIGQIHFNSSLVASLTAIDTSYYINNYVAPASGAVITGWTTYQYYTYASASLPVALSFFYVLSTTYTALYQLIVTGSGTTYEYRIKTGLVASINRIIIDVVLINIGSDGDPGSPPSPFITSLATLT